MDTTQKFGPFDIIFTHRQKNRWTIESSVDYEILFCHNDNPATAVKNHKISRNIDACIHKKESGASYLIKDKYIYIIFYKGFPNGGECWADINAGGHFNHCRDLPKNGAIILKAPFNPNGKYDQAAIVPATTSGNIKGISHKILAFELFCGVGYYNQLFSLELAIYMAIKSGRYLILNVRHPLAACGKPDRAYGLLVDYLDPAFKKLLIGFEVRAYKDFVTSNTEIKLPSKMSSCVVVDSELEKSPRIGDFLHYRQKIKSKHFWDILKGNDKVVYFSQSNASRLFGNFFTTSDNYQLMSQIALHLSHHRQDLQLKCNQLLLSVKTKHPRYLAAHLRLGDWHKQLNQSENIHIINNLKHWLKLHNHKERLPIFS